MDYLFRNAAYPDPHPLVHSFPDRVDQELGSEIDAAIAWAKKDKRWSDHAAKIKAPSYRDPHARAVIIAHHNHWRQDARDNNKKNKFSPQWRDRLGQREDWNKYAHNWLDIANQPRNSPFEKLNQFLQNILVVNYRTLRGSSDDPVADLHNHHKLIRDNFFGSYPDLCKKMFKGRGMGIMLDIIGSTKARPNENFARELMELFTMGVDNGYDEDDIKEAAKAFTGYVVDPAVSPYTVQKGQAELILDASRHDDTRKRVLARSRNMDGDGIVDTVFSRPEAKTFVPELLSHHCLVEGGLPKEILAPLGEKWREADFNIYWLVSTFFRSRIFYEPVFRGQIYKSPFQFYLGLLQDLGLQVEPSHEILREMDYLGQPFADPADVNGWDGGAFWMNNGTINARRYHRGAPLLRLLPPGVEGHLGRRGQLRGHRRTAAALHRHGGPQRGGGGRSLHHLLPRSSSRRRLPAPPPRALQEVNQQGRRPAAPSSSPSSSHPTTRFAETPTPPLSLQPGQHHEDNPQRTPAGRHQARVPLFRSEGRRTPRPEQRGTQFPRRHCPRDRRGRQ